MDLMYPKNRALWKWKTGEFTLNWVIRDTAPELRPNAIHIVGENIFQEGEVFVIKT